MDVCKGKTGLIFVSSKGDPYQHNLVRTYRYNHSFFTFISSKHSESKLVKLNLKYKKKRSGLMIKSRMSEKIFAHTYCGNIKKECKTTDQGVYISPISSF